MGRSAASSALGASAFWKQILVGAAVHQPRGTACLGCSPRRGVALEFRRRAPHVVAERGALEHLIAEGVSGSASGDMLWGWRQSSAVWAESRTRRTKNSVLALQGGYALLEPLAFLLELLRPSLRRGRQQSVTFWRHHQGAGLAPTVAGEKAKHTSMAAT